MLATLQGQRYSQLETRYAELDKQVLLLWGREDRVARVSAGERLANELGADLRVYPRCGHFPMIEASERSTADLVEFLR